MRVVEKNPNTIVVEISRDELLAINNALNEVLALIDDAEFATRLGIAKSSAKALLDEIGTLFDARQ